MNVTNEYLEPVEGGIATRWLSTAAQSNEEEPDITVTTSTCCSSLKLWIEHNLQSCLNNQDQNILLNPGDALKATRRLLFRRQRKSRLADGIA